MPLNQIKLSFMQLANGSVRIRILEHLALSTEFQAVFTNAQWLTILTAIGTAGSGLLAGTADSEVFSPDDTIQSGGSLGPTENYL
jgi:hypothetical protein